MASSSVGSGQYYCHLCQRSTFPTLEDSILKCSHCNQGFVEEIDSNDIGTVLTINDPNASLPINNLLVAMQSALGNVNVVLANENPLYNSLQDQPVSANTRSRSQRRPEMLMSGVEFFMQMLLNADLNPFSVGGPPPAAPADIASLPRKTLSQADLKTYDVCSICLEKFNVDDEMLTLPCLHGFHQPCLSTWLSQKGSCPICRKDIHGRDSA